MLFNELGLSAELLRAVEESGYTEATPIQQQAIPIILDGRDLLASARTGTGKTAGFMLPVLQRLHADGKPGSRPRVLVLTPTRELAAQVGNSARTYGRYLKARTAMIFGGVSIRPQITQLKRGVDIVVATPGRLLDHVEQRTIDLREISVLVLDEADRMLDMGFIRDIRRIMERLPKQRQNLLFSATFSQEIRKLANEFLVRPAEVDTAPRNAAAERVRQIVYPVDRDRKRELLSHRIGAEDWRQVLVFTRTKHGADRLARQLAQDGLDAGAIHGRKTQAARTRALADFKAGRVRVLVATDVAARGLDISGLPHVINYELPDVPEDYVHRIGRTARAGHDGQAISLVCIDELRLLGAIERLLGIAIERQVIPGYEVDPAIRPQPIQRGRAGSQRPAGGGGRRPERADGQRTESRRRKRPAGKGKRPAAGAKQRSHGTPKKSRSQRSQRASAGGN